MTSTEKRLEVTCSTDTRACEYRVGGYCIIGSAIYGLDSFPLLQSSHIDYSKVDPGVIRQGLFLAKSKELCT